MPYHVNASVELGTYRELVVLSACSTHARLIRLHFPNEHTESENSIYAKKFKDSFVVELRLRLTETIWSHSEVGEGLILASSKGSDGAWSTKTKINQNWIDIARLRGWKTTCDTRHGSHKKLYSPDSLSPVLPKLLVDTWNQCLAPACPSSSYIALSYLWGPIPFFTSLKHNLEHLQKPAALSEEGQFGRIPNTIRHAMALVKLLGERYLWVDSLCIPQDDGETKHAEIKNMGAIYANASLTIIASQGKDANFGLRGLEGISQSRNYYEETFELNGRSQIVNYQQADILLEYSTWRKRGWTFQEHVFSSRTLVFVDNTVFWKCPHSFWDEQLDHDYDRPSTFTEGISDWNELISARTPHLPILGLMICRYNERELTYPEDVLDGFAGPASVLTKNFPGGFLCGIPVTFFDIFLLWRPVDKVKRRIPKNPNSQRICLPSWSWAGWQGELDDFSFYRGFDFAKDYPSFKDGVHVSDEYVVPILRWSSHETQGSKGIPVASTWYQYRQEFLDRDTRLPPPYWRRCEYDEESFQGRYPTLHHLPRYMYTHDNYPGSQFWYPVPLSDSNHLPETHFGNFISCRTQRAWLYKAELCFGSGQRHEHPRRGYESLRDSHAHWVGMINMHRDSTSNEGEFADTESSQATEGDNEEDEIMDDDQRCGNNEDEGMNERDSSTDDARMSHETQCPCKEILELVAISQGYAYNSAPSSRNTILEWHHPERPKNSETYQFYNVLCIKREDSIAYRRGIGHVLKDAWERQKLEMIDLILG